MTDRHTTIAQLSKVPATQRQGCRLHCWLGSGYAQRTNLCPHPRLDLNGTARVECCSVVGTVRLSFHSTFVRPQGWQLQSSKLKFTVPAKQSESQKKLHPARWQTTTGTQPSNPWRCSLFPRTSFIQAAGLFTWWGLVVIIVCDTASETSLWS